MIRRRIAVAGMTSVLVGVAAALAGSPGPVAAAGKYPPIKHVFVVMLENEGYNAAFQTNPYPFLPALATKGALLQQYYGIGHESLPNYIALLGGMTPTKENQADCPTYVDLQNNTPNAAGSSGQDQGEGCVYLKDRITLANQLDSVHLTWKGYMEDMGFDATNHDNITCANANASATAGTSDMSQSAEGQNSTPSKPNDQYALRHNPFMYFHSIIDSPECARNVVTLQDPSNGMLHDLQSVATTPNFSFISPNLCDDGHDPSSTSTAKQCAAPDVAGDSTGNLKGIDDWLSAYIPKILASPAYQQDGMLVIAFDEAATSDVTSCCNEYNGPNTSEPGVQPASSGTSGGGQVGAVVLSRYVKPGTLTQQPYNHFALLRTLEDLFGCTGGDDHAGHLGAAADYNSNAQPNGPRPFGADVFTNPSGVVASATSSLPGGISVPTLTPGGTATYAGTTGALPYAPDLSPASTPSADAGTAQPAAGAPNAGVVRPTAFHPTGVAEPDSGFPMGMALLLILLPISAAGAAGFLISARSR